VGKNKKKNKTKKGETVWTERVATRLTFRGRASAPTTTFVHAPTQSRYSDNVLERTNNQARHETRNKERKKKGKTDVATNGRGGGEISTAQIFELRV
jgi:hypothetical protein